MKDRQYNGQKFEDSKGIIRSLKLKKDIQWPKVWRYQRGNQKGQSVVLNWRTDIQWPKFEDTKGVIRSLKLKKDMQYNGQRCEDTKGVIRSLKSKKGGQYNGQKDKLTDRQSTKQKTKEWATQTSLKTEGELWKGK